MSLMYNLNCKWVLENPERYPKEIVKVFLDGVKEKGCNLKNISDYLESRTTNSCENYEIQIAD